MALQAEIYEQIYSTGVTTSKRTLPCYLTVMEENLIPAGEEAYVTVHRKMDQLGQKIKSELLISLCRTHL